jgi:superfamily II RNA helicase
MKPEVDVRLEKVFEAIGVPAPRPFVADPFQLEALAAIADADCLVAVPTGAGKTWVAEQAIKRILETGGRSWYASPLKALSNAKYNEFAGIFGQQQVGILTGDRKENPEAPIIVGTTEILRNQLYDAMHRGETLTADFVVLDEAHFLGDPERGVVWEEIMIYLPPRIPLLLLSATIGNADEIACWLSAIRAKPCRVVLESRRPVPLYSLFLHPSGLLLPLLGPGGKKRPGRVDKKVRAYLDGEKPMRLGAPHRLPPFGQILRVFRRYRLLPAIFFLKSRADCDHALNLCSENLIRDPQHREALQQRIDALLARSPHIAGHRQLWQLKNLAVGAHHSGQLPSWKLVLESLMTEGLLDAVFATSTVAAGVNFPARTVVFLNSDKFNGTEFLPLTPTEFHQMTGRGGRRGMDRIGFAVVFPGKFMDTRLMAALSTSPPSPVTSQIRINFSMVLNLLLSHTPAQIEGLLSKSFTTYLIAHRADRKTAAGPRAEDPQLLWRDFQKHHAFLQATGYVDESDRLTDDGSWASQLRVDQPLLIAEGFRQGLFPESDPALLAALMASFVSERESDDRIAKTFMPRNVLKTLVKVKKSLRPFVRRMTGAGFEVRPLFLRPAVTVYAWASGLQWETVLGVAEIEEGNLAMLILRTADCLRHIRGLERFFPAAAETASRAIDLILREPVKMDYT